MTEYITGPTAGGGTWTPAFVVGNTVESCVHCARGCPKKNIRREPKIKP